jgi:hypothetical protein
MFRQKSWRFIQSANPITFLTALWLMMLVAVIFATTNAEASALLQSGERAPSGDYGFTYQGRLLEDGVAVSGSYDFEFRLFDALEEGNQIAQTLLVEDVAVADGYFTVALDFGPGVFKGTPRFLALSVRAGEETGEFMPLLPRQPLTATPLALALPGFYTEAISNTVNTYSGIVSHTISAGAIGAWVGGNRAGLPNHVTDDYGVILSGEDNTAGDNDGDPTTISNPLIVGGSANNNGGTYSAIVGGRGNRVEAFSSLSFIGGGRTNRVDIGLATIGGGIDNEAISEGASVLGGRANKATDEYATVGGGTGNQAGNSDGNPFNVVAATVAGGNGNHASATQATVGGGSSNVASGVNATVPGGTLNVAAGANSFAAGKNARAMHDGTFVWSDGTAEFASSLPNQFWVLASGGVIFNTGNNNGVVLNPGSGAWSTISDRNSKENVVAVDAAEILEAVAKMPIATWNYKSQAESVRHMGPMAQDFYAAFELGEDERHISTIDVDGVALASIQALYQLAQRQQAEIATLQEQNAAMSERLSTIEEGLAMLEEWNLQERSQETTQEEVTPWE